MTVNERVTRAGGVRDRGAQARIVPGRGPVEAWVWRIVLNAARSDVRRSIPAVDLDEQAATNGYPERDAELRVALARLPERQRTAVFLRNYADLDYVAIGQALRDPPRNLGGDPERSTHCAPQPTGGGPPMTDFDRASLDRILPAALGSPDWGDVMSRSGVRQGRRRWPLVALAAAILVAGLLVTPAFGIGGRSLELIKGAPGPPQVAGTPTWSPDGRMIAFNSLSHDGPGGYDVYVMNADGSVSRRLTRKRELSHLVARRAEARLRAATAHIFVMNTDGSGTAQADAATRRSTAVLPGRPTGGSSPSTATATSSS